MAFELADATVWVRPASGATPTAVRGPIRADGEGLTGGGVRLLRRSELRSASVIAHEGEATVLLSRGVRGWVEISVRSRAEGRALLDALEIDELSFVGRYWMSASDVGVSWPYWTGTVVAMIATFVARVPLFVFVPLLAALLIAMALRLHYRVRVGADGVHLARLFMRTRFIRYREMSLAKRNGTEVVLRASNGTKLVLHGVSLLGLEGERRAAALVEDINDRIAVARRPPDGSTPAMLRRGGRPVRAWLSAVVAPAHANVSYRESAMPSETLWRVLENPGETQTVRAAAAFALRAELDEKSRTRVARIAEACAEPKLRVALEAVASEDDLESVENALEPLEDEA